MKYNFLWYLLLSISFIITTITVNFILKGTIPTSSVLGSITGFSIAFIIIYATKKSLIRWIAVILATITVPIALVGIVALSFSLLSINLSVWSIIATYFVGFIIIFYLFIGFNSEHFSKFFSKSQLIDERNFYYLILSGFTAFIFLVFIILGTLIQPWLALDDLRLWIGVLIASVVFWIVTAAILEMKK